MSAEDEALSAEWQVWVAGNLVRERPIGEIVEGLVAGGLDAERAAREVANLAASAGVVAARAALRPLELASRLRRAHLRLGSRAVPVRAGLGRQEFMDQHVAAQQPVVLPDATAGWPARDWTWAGLVERFGDAAIDVCEGRAAAEHPDRRFAPLVVSRPFRDVVRRVLDPATGNDLYVIANNKALAGPLAGMLEDVGPSPAFLDPARLGISDIWMGPAGARTPLHHDTSSVLLCQLLGRKRILLAPPEEVEIADHAEGLWGNLDLEDPGDVAVRELLIPSGWWHQVVSLEPGISLTFAGFWHPNAYRWYAPGGGGSRG